MCYIFFWRSLCLLLLFLHSVLNPLQLFSQLPSQTQKDLKCLGVLPKLKILWERKAASALTSSLINIHISLYKCICQAKCHSKSCPFVLIDGRGISPTFKWPVNADPILKKSHLINQMKKGKKRKHQEKKYTTLEVAENSVLLRTLSDSSWETRWSWTEPTQHRKKQDYDWCVFPFYWGLSSLWLFTL